MVTMVEQTRILLELAKLQTPAEITQSEKRKRLELNLVREIEKAIADGLDLHFIAVELRAGGTDVRVSLNEAAKTTD